MYEGHICKCGVASVRQQRSLQKKNGANTFQQIAGFSARDLDQQKFQGPAIVGPPFPYYSRTIPIRNGNDMGGLWEGGPTIEGPSKNP